MHNLLAHGIHSFLRISALVWQTFLLYTKILAFPLQGEEAGKEIGQRHTAIAELQSESR